MDHKTKTDNPPPAEAISLDKIPGIDLNDGLARVGGKKPLYIRLLKSFVNKYHDIDEQVDKLLSEDNIQGIHFLCHSLKGAAGNVSAKDAFAVASEICRAASNHDREAIKRLTPRLGTAMWEVCDGVNCIDE